jgi:tRNA A-37 threonylcarbamoyl transferase component Bud32/tetratricopeptide (TPR) repeat protein
MRVSDSHFTSAPATELSSALERGTSLGRFLVLGLVGRGAMGEVYGAYDPELDRKIAIKLLRARHGDADDHRARLMREAKATAKISHENVVIVYDAGTFGERVFIAMEFVEGHTLRYWLQAQPREWQEVLDAFLSAGRGLAAAHEKDLVHRDFKPDNVMVAAQGGQVRVMDFGLARFVAAAPQGIPGLLSDLDGTIELSPGAALAPKPANGNRAVSESRDQLTSTGTVLGTPAYMSPEQFRSLAADARSDQFSFCVALYEALFHQRPFAGQTLQELSENVLAGRVRETTGKTRIPAGVRAALARGLSPRPEDRFPTMKALLEDLVRASSAGRTSFARGAAAKLAGVWEAPVDGRPAETIEKEAMRQAFLATGKSYAATTFAAASAVLDRYAQRWTELYVDACEATHVRGEQSAEVLDLRVSYLNESLDELKALCRLFRDATSQVVDNAVKAATALGTLERCQDVKALRAVIRPPDDPGTRAAVEALRLELVELRAIQRVGKWAVGLELAEALTEKARRVGYAPILAEVLLTAGQVRMDSQVFGDASTAWEEAYSTAIYARHDEVAAEAAIMMCFAVGYVKGQSEAAEVWLRSAEALLRRMGGHDVLWGWYWSHRANMRQQQGRLVEAIEDSRRAIAAHERAAGGAPNVDSALVTCNLANHLAVNRDFEGALVISERGMRLFAEVMGSDHPRLAVFQANHAQFLYRLGRLTEARDTARRALVNIERDSDSRGLFSTLPLRTLGLCALADGAHAEARALFERALAVREAGKAAPSRLAEIRAPLARALYALPGQRAQALALAQQARTEYESGALTPVLRMDLAELVDWIAERTRKPARRAKTKSGAKRAAASQVSRRRGARRPTPGARRGRGRGGR